MDYNRFPCLRMAFESGKQGGTTPTVYNAANEIAVARFLKGEIHFYKLKILLKLLCTNMNPMRTLISSSFMSKIMWARAFAASIRF